MPFQHHHILFNTAMKHAVFREFTSPFNIALQRYQNLVTKLQQFLTYSFVGERRRGTSRGLLLKFVMMRGDVVVKYGVDMSGGLYLSTQ